MDIVKSQSPFAPGDLRALDFALCFTPSIERLGYRRRLSALFDLSESNRIFKIEEALKKYPCAQEGKY